MSDEKIKEKPPIPPPAEQQKEPTAPKTSQSAFDKVMEQQKMIQQSPAIQSKFSDQSATEQRVREVSKWQEHDTDRRKKDDREDSSGKDKTKQKDKSSSITVTKEAVVRGGEKQNFGGGSGGKGQSRGGAGGEFAKRQLAIKKLHDIRGAISDLSQGSFGAKLSSALASSLKLQPKQVQDLVNKVIQSIKMGESELGWPELKLILRENIFSGLSLRFTSKHGKVSVQIDTADKKVKDLFTAEASKIKKALEEKGVLVSEIKVV